MERWVTWVRGLRTSLVSRVGSIAQSRAMLWMLCQGRDGGAAGVIPLVGRRSIRMKINSFRPPRYAVSPRLTILGIGAPPSIVALSNRPRSWVPGG
jgi:hypothetical protein